MLDSARHCLLASHLLVRGSHAHAVLMVHYLNIMLFEETTEEFCPGIAHLAEVPRLLSLKMALW